MSVFKTKNNQELIITCNCGCDESFHIKIEPIYEDEYETYALISYMNGKFYTDQLSGWNTIKKKLKKIWAIITNKDYYYSDVILNKNQFEEFREYINQIK